MQGEIAPQGWFSDPWELHEARYFSAGTATKLVRDGLVEAYEDPPDRPNVREPVPLDKENTDPTDLRRADEAERGAMDYSETAEVMLTAMWRAQ